MTRTGNPQQLALVRNPGGKPSATRAASASRAQRRRMLLEGNVNALSHGVFAIVANQRDVQIEVALIYVARPNLDPIADLRLVEQLATANVQRHRAIAAMEGEGFTQTLTSYASRLDALVERLERAVHERDRERAKVGRTVINARALDKYRPEDAS